MLYALCVLAALSVVVGRLLIDGRAALRAGDAAFASGDRALAVRHYLDAARLYVPGSASVRAALDRLDRVASAAESAAGSGDGAAADAGAIEQLVLARRAREAIRAGILGTRSFYTPFAERLTDSDAKLARLYARTEDARVDPGASIDARTTWHVARLARRPGPAILFVLMALGGFALWLGAAVAFFTRGLDRALRLRQGPAALAGTAFVVGFALFVVGLRLA